MRCETFLGRSWRDGVGPFRCINARLLLFSLNQSNLLKYCNCRKFLLTALIYTIQMQNRQTMMKPKTTATANFSADDDDVMFVPVQPSTSANDSSTDELSEWKGRALFLEQSVKGLEMENRELRHELGRTKNEMMRLQKLCEDAYQERDREINRRRTIQQFEEEERRAHAIASASLADPVPLTADERGRQELMKRIGPPMRRVTVSAVAQSHSAHRTPAKVGDTGTSTAAAAPTTTAVERVQHQQQGWVDGGTK
uniref:CCDC92 domain-containing protein n=1 Tax=Globodera pallida TaxID=36090 RepID=A0A183BJ27_GLOPA